MIQLKQPFINSSFGFQLWLTIVYPRVTDFPFVFLALLTNGTFVLMGPPVSCRTQLQMKKKISPTQDGGFGCFHVGLSGWYQVWSEFNENHKESQGPIPPERRGPLLSVFLFLLRHCPEIVPKAGYFRGGNVALGVTLKCVWHQQGDEISF